MNEPPKPSELPEILEAQWTTDQVEALFADLEQGAQVQRVQVRANRGKGGEDSAVSLAEARQLFRAGTARAIQIYYNFEGQSWCDTLMVLPEHVRVIRTVVPSAR